MYKICCCLILLALLYGSPVMGTGRQITIENKCAFDVMAYVAGQGGVEQSRDLTAGQSWITSVVAGWTGGRIWAQVPGYPIEPNTLAEFTMNGFDNFDYYDISLVDGFNLPMGIYVTGGQGNCTSAECAVPLLSVCPSQIQVTQEDKVVACDSACYKWQNPTDCCQGVFDNVNCPPSNYSKWFKEKCPNTFTYPFDSNFSQYACKLATYTVTFCPPGSNDMNSTSSSAHVTTTTSGVPITSSTGRDTNGARKNNEIGVAVQLIPTTLVSLLALYFWWN